MSKLFFTPLNILREIIDLKCGRCHSEIENGGEVYLITGDLVYCQKCAKESAHICPRCGKFKWSTTNNCFFCLPSEVRDNIMDSFYQNN
jgi:predicted amidophosphoribosyltransferase